MVEGAEQPDIFNVRGAIATRSNHGVGAAQDARRKMEDTMNWRQLLFSSAMVALSASAALAQTVEVFKDANCGCCGGWIAHMRENGFTVTAANVTPERMDEIKAKAGLTENTSSCHTAFVGGYFVEGHVPAQDVIRLLAERPDAMGVTAPGMPLGSPGMDGAGVEPYKVLLVLDSGRTEVFASH
ncbi:hypothetical protein BURK2_00113 [Burkholderiales bacterium]|nr:hypothetical protein BURK2_00113 [Burkholderiales bacterium]